MSNFIKVKRCRICNGRLEEMFKIPPQYIASTFVKSNKNNPKSKIKIPMTVMLCRGFRCGLIQLKETVNPDLLYSQYFYRSNISDTMKKDLQDVVDSVCRLVNLKTDDKVLDIGCNDGLMLSMFPDYLNKEGIDPATNIVMVEEDYGIVFQDYFPSPLLIGPYKVITSTACFYDLPDPNKAVAEMKKLLDKDGVICIQVSYLYDTIKDMNFYDFVHEHLEYYSLFTLMNLFDRNGLKVFDATTNQVNGGSLRVYVTHKENKRKVSDNIAYLLQKEAILRLDNGNTYIWFSKLIKLAAKKVKDYIKAQKGLVIALGASTKGNVLLQICNLTKKDIPYISERAEHKIGLRNLGLDMKLISEEEARAKKPVCMFVIPWNFKAEIVEREKDYIKNGGKLLFIMPYPYILDKDGEHRI